MAPHSHIPILTFKAHHSWISNYQLGFVLCFPVHNLWPIWPPGCPSYVLTPIFGIHKPIHHTLGIFPSFPPIYPKCPPLSPSLNATSSVKPSWLLLLDVFSAISNDVIWRLGETMGFGDKTG